MTTADPTSDFPKKARSSRARVVSIEGSGATVAKAKPKITKRTKTPTNGAEAEAADSTTAHEDTLAVEFETAEGQGETMETEMTPENSTVHAVPVTETNQPTPETEPTPTSAQPQEAPTSTNPDQPARPTFFSAFTGTTMARPPEPGRFNIFVIDTGWNVVASKLLAKSLPLIRDLNPSDGTYVLDRERSISVLRRHAALIGRDPIISVHDLDVIDRGVAQHEHARVDVHGFRLHLGLVKSEEKIKDALDMFVRFLRRHRDSRHLEKDVREKLRKEGLAGTIEIMGKGVELFRG
jgi:hypothetical protein